MSQSFFTMAIQIALSHHERWDGGGYPHRLAGEEIPLSARIMSLADVYDALRSRRPYKEPMDHDQASSIIMDGAGTQFDPTLTETFKSCHEEFVAIATEFSDEAATILADTKKVFTPISILFDYFKE